MTAVLALALLAGTPASAAPKKPAPTAAPPLSVVEGLHARAKGAPLLLVLTKKNQVEARTPDGAFAEVVVKGPVDDAVWDARRELLWLRKKDTVEVLDLRVPDAKPVRIAEKVPAAQLVVSWDDETIASVRQGPERVYVGPRGWDGAPELRGVPAPLETDENVLAGFEAKMAAAAFVGAEWLGGEVDRAARPVEASRWIDPARKIPLPAAVACTDDANWPVCGAATEVGPWLLVVESVGCGDVCDTSCRLYDPATNTPLAVDPRRAAPASLPRASTCGPYAVEPTGGWVLFPEGFTTVACAVAGGCHVVPGDALGWLDPAPRFGADSY